MVKILCTPVTAEISSGRTSQRAQETQLASQNIRRIFHFEVFHHFVASLCSSLTCRAIFYLIIKFYKFKITWRIFPAQHSSIALFNVRWIRYFSCELQEEMRRSEVVRRFDLYPLSPASFLFSSQKTNVSKPSSSILLQNWCSLCSLFLEVHKNLIFVLRHVVFLQRIQITVYGGGQNWNSLQGLRTENLNKTISKVYVLLRYYLL